MAAANLASFDVGPLLTWVVNEVSLLATTTAPTTDLFIKIRPR
jgi:hypothetical protein